MERIVAVQGTVQLAAAISAMRALRDPNARRAPTRDHLLIHDLYAPDGNGREFADCIRSLAETAQTWASIRYFEPTDLLGLKTDLQRNARDTVYRIRQNVGLERCDELVVGQNDLPFLNCLRLAFADSKHTNFGDGIGLNFSKDYMNPKRHHSKNHTISPIRRGYQAVQDLQRQSISRIRNGRLSRPRPVDQHCLLLPNLFDQQVDNAHLISANAFRNVFEQFAQHFEAWTPNTHARLKTISQSDQIVVFLLTSNMTEAGRMTQDAEISGYKRLLSELPKGRQVTLVIKPHPRDDKAKLRCLSKQIEHHYGDTLLLDDPRTFFLPFESLYARYFAASHQTPERCFVATVSSACISLEHLYRQRCVLGFGEEIVQDSFNEPWRSLRKAHEQDLLETIELIRLEQKLLPSEHARESKNSDLIHQPNPHMAIAQ